MEKMMHQMTHAQGESRLCYLFFISSGFCLLTVLTVIATDSHSYIDCRSYSYIDYHSHR